MADNSVTPYNQASNSEVLDQTEASGMVSSDLPPPPRRLSRAVLASIVGLIFVFIGGGMLVTVLASNHNIVTPYKTTNPTLPTSGSKLQLQDVIVNGQLYVNNSLVIKPSILPTSPSLGQIYLDSSTKLLNYFNGSQFVALGLGPTSSSGSSLQGGTVGPQGAAGSNGLQGPAGAGGGTSTNATTLTSGTLSDNRLSPNVALLNRDDQIFHGRRQAFQNSANDSNAFSIQAADGTSELSVNTLANTITTTDLLPALTSSIASSFTSNAIITPNVSLYNDNTKWSALGPDGFVQFAYFDTGYTALHLVHCTNADCTTKTDVVVVTDPIELDEPSVAVGSDGFARIAYINYNNSGTGGELHYIRCTNSDCSTNVNSLVETGAYYNTSIGMGADGLARIVYADGYGPDNLKLARCLNTDCTSRNVTILDNTSHRWLETDNQSFGPDGFLRIAYSEDITGKVKFIQCTNADCTGVTPVVVDTQTNNYYVSLAIAPDGFARLVYNGDISLKYAQCTNASCSASNITTLDKDISGTPSIAVGSDGLARISYNYYNGFNVNVLKYLFCSNADCSSATRTILNSVANTGTPNSLVLGTDGFARIVSGIHQIFFTRLLNNSGQDNISGTSIGSNTSRFGALTNTSINTQELTVQGAPGSNQLYLLQVNDSAGNNLATINNTGSTRFQNSTDSTAAFVVQSSNGANLITADTTNIKTYTLGILQNTGGIVVNNMSFPSNVNVTNQGTAGSTTYTYTVTASNSTGGESSASTAATTTTGNATLNGSNFNRITWAAVDGAHSYNIYRTVAGGTPSSIGILGTVAAASTRQFDDTGLVAFTGAISPLVDSSAGVYSGDALTLKGGTGSDGANFVKIGIGNNGVQGNVYSAYAFAPYATSGAILHQFDYNSEGSGPAISDNIYLASYTLTNNLNGTPQSVLSLSTSGKILFGSAYDTNLYRSATGVLKTDSSFVQQTATNSTTAFQIQNTAAVNLFTADTSNLVITIAGTTSTFASLTLTNAHFKSTQTTAPTAGTPSSCGTSPTGAVTAGSTDSAGSFTLTSGSTSTTATCQIVISFNKAYGSAPKSVVISGASTNASKMTPAVTAISTTTFTVVLPQTDAVSTAYQFYYWVTE